jgi:hypothetical protein
MTSRGENVRMEVPPFSFSAGERKIMDHFVVSPVVSSFWLRIYCDVSHAVSDDLNGCFFPDLKLVNFPVVYYTFLSMRLDF